MIKSLSLLSLLTVAAALPAQTYTLRGGVEDVQNTQNQFYLDCTNIPVVSTAVNLNLWTNTEAIMQVVNIGTVQNPILRVDSIAPTVKTFDMGNLRFNQADTWEVNAVAGSFAMVFINFTWNTTFTPFGSECFLLGASPFALRSGFATAQNQFQFLYTIPNMPQYTGISVSGQALVVNGSNWFFTNADCKEIGN